MIGAAFALAVLVAAPQVWAAPSPASKSTAKSVPAPASPAPEAAPVPDSSDADHAKDDAGKSEGAGLPIPRFVSLRTDPINLRTGPGMR
jgi:hypothetical protein